MMSTGTAHSGDDGYTSDAMGGPSDPAVRALTSANLPTVNLPDGYRRRMRGTRLCLVAGGLSVLLAILITAQPTAAAPSQQSKSTAAATPTPDGKSLQAPNGPLPADPTTALEAKANEVSSTINDAVSKLPGFGGIWVDEAGITHIITLPGSADDTLAAIGDRFAGQYVVEDGENTYGDLVARRNSISGMIGELKRQGLDMLEWGPDEQQNTMWISLIKYTPEKADLARKLLGQDIVVEQAMTDGGPDDLFSRVNDTSPYSAGIFLYPAASNQYPYCTSGMPIYKNSVRYLVSAAHCYDPAFGAPFPDNVYNGGSFIGVANWADFTNNGTDSAIVSAPGSFTLYRTSSSYTSIGTTPWNSLVGQTVCAGGAFTGEKCSLPVIKVNYCSTYYGYRITCGVSTAGAGGAEAGGHGDSGGPMYILAPSQKVSGIIVAAASPQFTCTTQGPVLPGSVRTCSDYVRFQTAASILSHWGTTM